MNENKISLGTSIFHNMHNDPYLNELYDSILYNHSTRMFGVRSNDPRLFIIEDALRFADILSKSTDLKMQISIKLKLKKL